LQIYQHQHRFRDVCLRNCERRHNRQHRSFILHQIIFFVILSLSLNKKCVRRFELWIICFIKIEVRKEAPATCTVILNLTACFIIKKKNDVRSSAMQNKHTKLIFMLITMDACTKCNLSLFCDAEKKVINLLRRPCQWASLKTYNFWWLHACCGQYLFFVSQCIRSNYFINSASINNLENYRL
jgi:hypothetical protein